MFIFFGMGQKAALPTSSRRFLGSLISINSILYFSLFCTAQEVVAQKPTMPRTATNQTPQSVQQTTEVTADIIVYGNTSAAVIAAVQAKRMSKSVVIVGPDQHLGGLTAGGLGWTDSGRKKAIGGLSRNFYHRIWKHYQSSDAWPWQEKADFGNRNQSPAGKDGHPESMWVFEPSVAETVFEQLVAEYDIPVYRNEFLDRTFQRPNQSAHSISQGVTIHDGKITSIRMLSGKTFHGRMFLDTTYEGDLMACAGVSYHVGREANSIYDEHWNGVQTGTKHHHHYFKTPVSAYVVSGDPTSGILPLVSELAPGTNGDGDHRIQAYCFRMCLTDHDPNRIPFPKPVGYDANQYKLLARVFQSGWRETFEKFDRIQNFKTDTNNHGPVSTDYIGMNYDYPEASYARRAEIVAEHERYQKGLMYFTANHPSVPEDVRQAMSKWGLSKDEFQDNGGWPHQIYVREARRMISNYVMTEHDCLGTKVTPDSIGMGSYALDSHNTQRYIDSAGNVQNEGDLGVKAPTSYKIAYGAIVPKKDQCTNLLVPVCVSSSHIAFGSIRMEPVFMILGQSAATAACLSIDKNVAVQDLNYTDLKLQLERDKQVLDIPTVPRFRSRKLKGIVVDDNQAKLQGHWSLSAANDPFVGSGYRHSGGPDSTSGSRSGTAKSAEFKATLKPGRYEVRMFWPTNSNRASNVPVIIAHAEGSSRIVVNQKTRPKRSADSFSLGTFRFDSNGSVKVETEETDGYVVVDAIQFLPRSN